MDAHNSVTALCCIGVAWQYIVYSVLAPVVPAFQAHEIWPFHTGRWPVSESIRCGCGAPVLVWRPLPPPRAGEAIGPAVVGVELVVEEAPEPPPPLLLLLLLLLAAAAVAIAACCCAIRSHCLHNERRWKKPEKRKRIRYAVQKPPALSLSQQQQAKKAKKEKEKGETHWFVNSCSCRICIAACSCVICPRWTLVRIDSKCASTLARISGGICGNGCPPEC